VEFLWLTKKTRAFQEAQRLKKKLERTQEDLRQARLIIEAQKKIAQMYREAPEESGETPG
jgi:hypothetical protein